MRYVSGSLAKMTGFSYIYRKIFFSIANIKMTSSIIINEGRPDEECDVLSRE